MTVLASALVLAGCAVPGTSPQRRVFLNSLIGHTEADLVRTFGVPSRSIRTGDRLFLAYDRRRVDVVPGWNPWGPWYWGTGFPPEVVVTGCETTFEIATGRIVAWTDRGNDCG